MAVPLLFFFSSRRRHTRSLRDWSSDVCSSDLSANEGGKVDRVERLGHVMEPADVQTPYPIAQVGPRGQEDDRDRPRGLVGKQSFGHAPAVEAGHHHVEEDGVRLFLLRQFHTGRAVWGLHYLDSLSLQIHAAEEA